MMPCVVTTDFADDTDKKLRVGRGGWWMRRNASLPGSRGAKIPDPNSLQITLHVIYDKLVSLLNKVTF